MPEAWFSPKIKGEDKDMKVSEGMKLIASGWIQKPKGFRVRFQIIENGELKTGYSPPLGEDGMASDVTTWRYAWKLYMATKSDQRKIKPGELVNIVVVDENDTPIPHYETGTLKIFNPKNS